MIVKTENALTTMSCFFAARWNCNLSHSIGHVQFDHFHDGILVTMPTGFLKEVEGLGLYDVSYWLVMIWYFVC